MSQLIDIFLNLDAHLAAVISEYGTFTYVILFVIIFCETGLVVTPFLPGDSLLFAAGAFAARGSLNLVFLLVLLSFAAVIGDSINYVVGRTVGKRLPNGNKFIKKEYIDRTQQFYKKHGAKTIILARYMPIIRTFAPFVAGIAGMDYRVFVTYNIIGGVAWVLLMTCAGYLFGTIPFVEKHFELVILGIIFVSFVPGIFSWLRHKVGGNGKR